MDVLLSFKRWKKRQIYRKAANELGFLKAVAKEMKKGERPDLNIYFEILPHSKSQIKQDIFVLSFLDFIKKGYFVEFGASDGICLSNTYLLEKKFGWDGILSEPAKKWHNDIITNRDVNLNFDCVWHTSNEKIQFWELSDGYFSGIASSLIRRKEQIKKLIKNKREYSVNTISLYDLLEKYNAPKKINYLSIDTEGTEFEILRDFDFTKYKFSVITVEHNFTNQRESLYKLLTSNGYKRVLK